MKMCDFVPPHELVKGAYELLVHLSGGPTTNVTFQHVRIMATACFGRAVCVDVFLELLPTALLR